VCVDRRQGGSFGCDREGEADEIRNDKGKLEAAAVLYRVGPSPVRAWKPRAKSVEAKKSITTATLPRKGVIVERGQLMLRNSWTRGGPGSRKPLLMTCTRARNTTTWHRQI